MIAHTDTALVAISRREVLIAMTAGVAAPKMALAQADFPNRPIVLIVPWPPGGGTDAHFRALAQAANKHLKQPIVIENKPGASGTLAASAMATTARPDGYTLMQIPGSVISYPTFQKMNYDPVKDFTYVIMLSGYTFGIVVRPEAPYKTFAEFIAYARSNPDRINYGITGVTSGQNLVMRQIAEQAGIKWTAIPFKGSADAMQALLGGHVDALAEATAWAPFVETGKMRLLATFGDKRTKNWPQVPTLKESGFDFVLAGPYGIAGPKGIDPAIVRTLHDAFRKAIDDPEHLKALDRLNQEVQYMGPEEYTRWVAREYEYRKTLSDKYDLKTLQQQQQ